MIVADLFVNLGVKGTAKIGQTLSSMKNGLTDVSASGIAAKGAVLALAYALESAVTDAIKLGNVLSTFSDYTGLDPVRVQRFTEALMDAGVSADDTRQSLAQIQKTMSGYKWLGQAPSGLGRIAARTGLDIKALQNDPFYAFKKLIEYRKLAIKEGLDIGQVNRDMESFGLTPTATARAGEVRLDPDKLRSGIPGALLKKLDRSQIGVNQSIYNLKQTGAAMLGTGLKAADDVTKGASKILNNKGGVGTGFGRAILDAIGVTPTEAPSLKGAKPHGSTVVPTVNDRNEGRTASNQQMNSFNIKVDNHGVEGADEIDKTLGDSINFAMRQLRTGYQVT